MTRINVDDESDFKRRIEANETQSMVEADLLRIFRMLPEQKRTEIMRIVSAVDRECREEKDRTIRTETGDAEKTAEITWVAFI